MFAEGLGPTSRPGGPAGPRGPWTQAEPLSSFPNCDSPPWNEEPPSCKIKNLNLNSALFEKFWTENDQQNDIIIISLTPE